LIKQNISPKKIKEDLGFTLISDENLITNIIKKILETNPTLKNDYKTGKTRVQGFVMGQLMKETKGKVNPAIANKLIIKELNS
ncbi:MAG: Asp-tRNA(Asn)/Glu-tRNA(Gln) amidotransferase GatCAB subunit B, partial [Firmicutes bacterium]|nr:Asp-tRNA(Asn)/Glu-tRNA(Gln) amidotransferase GatCAB subunit B [Candidatus Onthovivens merdipullorum]